MNYKRYIFIFIIIIGFLSYQIIQIPSLEIYTVESVLSEIKNGDFINETRLEKMEKSIDGTEITYDKKIMLEDYATNIHYIFADHELIRATYSFDLQSLEEKEALVFYHQLSAKIFGLMGTPDKIVQTDTPFFTERNSWYFAGENNHLPYSILLDCNVDSVSGKYFITIIVKPQAEFQL